MRYAIYSEKQAKVSGEVVYARIDGTEVVCSSVGDTPDCGCKFDDVRELGLVDEFVRRISRGSACRATK